MGISLGKIGGGAVLDSLFLCHIYNHSSNYGIERINEIYGG